MTLSKEFYEIEMYEFELILHGNGLIDNSSSMVQGIAWFLAGDKPLQEPVMIQHPVVYMHHLTSVS